MNRIPAVVYEELTPKQRRAFDIIAGPRDGVVNGPFLAWVRNPDLVEKIQSVSDVLRGQSSFDKRRFELMSLVVARYWNASYMWGTHEAFALKAGLPQGVVEAIRNGQEPSFEDEDDKLIYSVVRELMKGKVLSQDTYDRGLAALGLERMIELATVTGFYLMIGVVLNAFDVPVMPGQRTLP